MITRTAQSLNRQIAHGDIIDHTGDVQGAARLIDDLAQALAATRSALNAATRGNHAHPSHQTIKRADAALDKAGYVEPPRATVGLHAPAVSA